MDTHLVNNRRQILNQACSYSFHYTLHLRLPYLGKFTKHGGQERERTFSISQNSSAKYRAWKWMPCAENDKKSRTVAVGASGWWTQSLELELLSHEPVKGPRCLVRRTGSVHRPRSRSQTGGCITITGGFRKQRFWFTWSRVGSENLYF